MADLNVADYYKFGGNGKIGKVLKSFPFPPSYFVDRAAFEAFAQESLRAQRGNSGQGEWPDGILLRSYYGKEIYRWDLNDQLKSQLPLTPTR